MKFFPVAQITSHSSEKRLTYPEWQVKPRRVKEARERKMVTISVMLGIMLRLLVTCHIWTYPLNCYVLIIKLKVFRQYILYMLDNQYEYNVIAPSSLSKSYRTVNFNLSECYNYNSIFNCNKLADKWQWLPTAIKTTQGRTP